MRFWVHLTRSLQLRCPRCGIGKIFRDYLHMYEACSHCGLTYERAPGYFLGSIYFNYTLTALLVLVSYLALYFTEAVSSQTLLYGELALSVLFPLWFFRYARSLWIAFDQYFDPLQE